MYEATPPTADAPLLAVMPSPADPHAATLQQGAFGRGWVLLDRQILRRLRQSRLMSQQDLADDCWRRNIRVSIATIKRAESGRPVRFRIARELARCFSVSVATLLPGTPTSVMPT